uniref:Uncharacterized protein n=2 Tax=environmental samples TaxID=68359 RepID=A0A075I3V3_9EURY|nr:hypothetical protein [uncultured marine group II/III euryarchaeote KM3_87_C01]AIF20618.1 hypothetical protein [uncultured marine group II/III euryarchaeote KM3_91_A10]
MLGGPHQGVISASNEVGAPSERASSSLVRESQKPLLPGLIPREKSSSRIGTIAPAPSPDPSAGQRGCLSLTKAILHSLITRGSNMRSPSYHHAHTIPGMTCPPSSSIDILEPGFHQCPLTLIAGVSLVDHSIISCRERLGSTGSGTNIITQYHHQDSLGMGGITSSLHRRERSPTNFSILSM